MTDITKEIIKRATLGIQKGMKKIAISIHIAFRVDVLIRNENIISKKYNTKNPLK